MASTALRTTFHWPARRGCAGLPAQQVVGQVSCPGHVAKVGDGIRRQALRRLLANHAPHPVALFGREVHAPFVVELRGGVVRIALRQLDERQRHQFLAHLAAPWRGPAGIWWGNPSIPSPGPKIQARRFPPQRVPSARAVGFDRQARLAPDIVGRELLVAVQLARRMGAAVVACRAGHTSCGAPRRRPWLGQCLQGIDQQGIAAHFLVVRHAVAGCCSANCAQSRRWPSSSNQSLRRRSSW